jgi:MraZ protein
VEASPRFSGKQERSLDAKGRFVLPQRYRESFDSKAFLCQHLDGCLAVWTPAEFANLLDQWAVQQHESAEQRNRVRVMVAGSEEVDIDKQGRIPVPPHLKAYAGLDRTVLVVGAIERIEVWAPERWEQRTRPSELRLSEGSDPPPALSVP